MGRLLTATDVILHDQPTFEMTLLELVTILFEITNSEEETMNMALSLVTSGEVRLTGNFGDEGPTSWN